MIKQQWTKANPFGGSSQRTERLDPRYLEHQEARRKMVLCTIQSSYSNRSDTVLWAFMIWAASAFALAPFQRFTVASAFAVFVALAWTTVHKVRRS
jgi:hypothetical protein